MEFVGVAMPQEKRPASESRPYENLLQLKKDRLGPSVAFEINGREVERAHTEVYATKSRLRSLGGARGKKAARKSKTRKDEKLAVVGTAL